MEKFVDARIVVEFIFRGNKRINELEINNRVSVLFLFVEEIWSIFFFFFLNKERVDEFQFRLSRRETRKKGKN